MIICDQCGHSNREGFLYCDKCGSRLVTADEGVNSTRQLDEAARASLSAKATWGTARLNPYSEVMLHIVDSKDPIKLKVIKHSVIGRMDDGSQNQPDVNLAPYSGLEKGVSRNHAVIERNEDTLMIMDMQSSNGTYLNGQRLVPHQPRVLRDGDEIRFGRLVTRIYFK